MALCRDKVLVKRFSIETRSDRAVPTMDWVRSLPSNVQRNILGRIFLEEVGGTSILSTTSNWSKHSVIFDKRFFRERGEWIDEHPSALANIVTKVLTIHSESLIPIQKFVLHIPDMQYKWGLYIDIWLSYLSRNSIKELSVDNWNIITYKLSSLLFDFDELTRLMLRNCAFRKSSGVFQKLRFLSFEKIAFGSVKVGDLTLSTPLLVQVELVDCTGFQYLNIHAPELNKFVAASSDGMSQDDVNQMRSKLGRPTLEEEEENFHCYSCRGSCFLCLKCPGCPGCWGWPELFYREEYVFYPKFGLRQCNVLESP